MNYHHIYHAGNFADVFKHLILCFCLEKLHEKPASFFALDTHAGIGKYDLSDEKSLKTFEANNGIKKLLAQKNYAEFLPERYLNILAKINKCQIDELGQKLRFYSGSPALIRDYLRSQDRAIFAELNHQDFLQLRKNFAGSSKFSFVFQDGFELIKSKLPPLEKRALVIIDAAFEKDQSKISLDWQKIVEGLNEAQKRSASAIYLVWYPIIKSDAQVLKKFGTEMAKLKFEKVLHATFDIGQDQEETKMHACGMFIFNAPWQLDEKLKIIMPQILQILKKNDSASFKINSLGEF